MEPRASRTIDPGHVSDASGFEGWAEAFFAPANESEVAALLNDASKLGIPVTVLGAGSGLTGARVAQGGWVLSLERFRKLEIGEGSARVGPAITLVELNQAAGAKGQFYAPDPTENTASIGGTIGTNASGSRSFRYGSTRRHVLALRIALVDGTVREFRRGDKVDFEIPAIPLPQTSKYTAGYPLVPGMDWIDLFCGSEGTLGVTVEAELSLLPTPEHLFAGVVFFPTDESALAAVDEWRGLAELRMIEYMDANSLALLRDRYREIPVGAHAALLIEAEGEDIDAWDERLTQARALTEASWFAAGAADRERFRKFRHTLPEIVNRTMLERGYMKMGSDFAVPISKNREMLIWYRERLDRELPGHYVIYGHIGDAHVHVNMLPATGDEMDRAKELMDEFAAKAVEFGGTVSAEHGLGKRKAHFLTLQYAPDHIEAMRAVKRRLDPNWILGRGTLFPYLPA
jgi:FAD/FMN-containing dehydrogenase